MQPAEREQRLAERRGDGKDFACDAVEGYMAAMRVSLDDLIQNRRERDESLKRLSRGDYRERSAAIRMSAWGRCGGRA